MTKNIRVFALITVIALLMSCTQTTTDNGKSDKVNMGKNMIQSTRINGNLVETDRFQHYPIKDYEFLLNEMLTNFKEWRPERSNFKGNLKIHATNDARDLDTGMVWSTPDGYLTEDYALKGLVLLDSNLNLQVHKGQMKGFFDKKRPINIQIMDPGDFLNFYKNNDRVSIICKDYSTGIRYWDLIIQEPFRSLHGYIIDKKIIYVEYETTITIDLETGALENIYLSKNLVNGQPSKKYYWYIEADYAKVGQDFDDLALRHLLRYNPETKELNELRFNGLIKDIFYVDNKFYICDDQYTLHEINENTGEVISTYDLNSKLKNVNRINQSEYDSNYSAIEIRAGQDYYLFKSGNLAHLGKSMPYFIDEYFIQTDQSFFGINENTGERTWEIRKNLLEGGPMILHIDNRGILVTSNNQLYIFKP